ncbi:Shikimate kinase II [Methanosarcina horonobensis HB-1 = JCM 15518]|uniref:Shikimate kinase II n=1 Tax=Methanosarcina horonobensis HB-1 = JCM 15518 TaxID=1434110 RepID=A0A0E3SGX5_9EURY|nr:Shikimate kinase II [Methanosarcina horonobensis HB-1 = JCM 15518]
MGCENMDKRKKVSKRNYFRIKQRVVHFFLLITVLFFST